MVAIACEETPNVVTVNVADVFPIPIVTLPGHDAFFELLESFTTVVAAAGAVKVAVPVLDAPPGTVVGLRLIDCNVGGLIVSVAD